MAAVTLLGATLAGSALPAEAAGPIVVTTTADVIDSGDGLLSLREAVDIANATPGPDEIVLQADTAYELTRCPIGEDDVQNATGSLDHVDGSGTLTIAGNGASITQTCAGSAVLQAWESPTTLRLRDLELFGDPSASAVAVVDGDLDNVSVANGYYGVLGHHLVVSHSQVTQTRQPVVGADSSGSVTITDSTIEHNGDGVVGASLTVLRTSIVDNQCVDVAACTGGIHAEHLVLSDSAVVGNGLPFQEAGAAGGTDLGGAITIGPEGGPSSIVRSRIEKNRGWFAIGAINELTISESEVRDNESSITAIVALDGPLSIEGSTIAGNSVPSGAGPWGAVVLARSLSLRSSTVTGNTSGGSTVSLLAAAGMEPSTLAFSTIVDNQVTSSDAPGAAIHLSDSGEIEMQGTVIGTSGDLAVCRQVPGPDAGGQSDPSGWEVVSHGWNVLPDSSCGSGQESDLIGVDPVLGALGDHGGPTSTRLPLPGSPLLGRIPADDPACGGTDQRGVARPVGTGCEPGAVEVPDPPGAPRTVTASPGDGSARVSWAAPSSDGGSPITAYHVTASPGGQTCTWTAGPLTCTIEALTNGTTYTVTVRAENAYGIGPASEPSNAVTPHAEAPVNRFVPLDPVRIVDSRPASQVGPFSSPWGPGVTRQVQVAGVGGVPSGAVAVVLNVTVTDTTASSFLSVWPAGAPRPTASSLNWQAGWTVPNAVTVKLGAGGKVSVFNHRGAADVVIDVVGYFESDTGAGSCRSTRRGSWIRVPRRRWGRSRRRGGRG
jgi:hypothetical protein